MQNNNFLKPKWVKLGTLLKIPDPKTMDYSPQKRPEMPEITSFDGKARVMYRGSRVSKSSRDPKTMDYNPRKRPEMPEIMSFDGTA